MENLKKISGIFFAAFLFFLPISTILIIEEKFIGSFKFQYGSFGIYGAEILLWIALMLFFIANFKYIADILKKPNLNKSLKRFFFISLLVLIFISGVSIFWSIDKRMAFYAFFRILEGGAIFSFLLLNYRKRYLWILFYSGLFQAIFVIAQFFMQISYANKYLGTVGHLPYEAGALVLHGSGRWLRAYGLVNDPNLLGGFMLFAIIISIYLYIKSKNKFESTLSVSGTVIFATALFFSFSRSALIGLIVALTFVFIGIFVKNKTALKKFLTPAIISLVVLGILTTIYFPIIAGRIFVDNRLESHSLNERYVFNNQAISIIKNKWLYGTGIGNYTFNLLEREPDLKPWQYQPTHNIYLLIFAELGIIAITSFIVLSFFAIKIGIKNKNFIFLGLFIGFMFIGLWDHYFWTTWQGISMWWISLALLLAIDI